PELEEAVGGDAELRARDRGHARIAPGGDDDVRGGERAPGHADGVRVREPGAAPDELDVLPGEVGRVQPVQVGDVGVAPVAQPGPVVPLHGEIEAVVPGVVLRSAQLGGVPHDLLRHAADVHAGAGD